MKQLKFNNPKILKALLDKTKTTFIEKAWGESIIFSVFEDKPCRYKVGEVVEVVWKVEVKCEFFNIKDGKSNLTYGRTNNFPESETRKKGIFNKNLGKVKITKIEKIDVDEGGLVFLDENVDEEQAFHGSRIYRGLKTNRRLFEISKSEGFKNPEEMFKFLEEYVGDLSKAKPFWLISFEWVNEK